MKQLTNVIALCGATASGKSSLGLYVAKRFNGEIVCMDSMQIYRGLDIGTAKPSPQEQYLIPHHMLDIRNPDEHYSVADYAADCTTVMQDIAKRGKTPILVGGTGLYLKALLHGYQLGSVVADSAFRTRMQELAKTEAGKMQLYRQLQQKDADTAARLHPNDIRRVIRALEVAESGTRLPEYNQKKSDQPFRFLPIAIDHPRSVLYERIEKRVYQMIEDGLCNEVKAVWHYVPETAQCFQAIGYKEWIPFFRGEIDEKETIRRIIVNTRHYAKRQITLQKTVAETVWLPYCDGIQELASKTVQQFLEVVYEP